MLNQLIEIFKTNTDLLLLLYKDLAQPGVKKVGKALETTLDLSNTILLPLKLINEKSQLLFQHNMEKFKEKLSIVDVENIIDVPPEISMPIIDKLTYVADDNISDLYTNLLASASDNNRSNYAHPSFSNIIENISPDEAKIINYLLENIVDGVETNIKYIYFILHKNDSGYNKLSKKLTSLEKQIKLQYPENILLYIDNLIGIGILYDKEGIWMTSSYDDLLSYYEDVRARYISTYGEDKKITFNKSYYELSEIGRNFIIACGYEQTTKFNNGYELLKNKKYKEAIMEYETLLESGFKPQNLIINLLECYLITGQYDTYIKLFNDNYKQLKSYSLAIIYYFELIFNLLTSHTSSFKMTLDKFEKLEDIDYLKMKNWDLEVFETIMSKIPDSLDKEKVVLLVYTITGNLEIID